MEVGLGGNVARINVAEVVTALWTFANAQGLLTDDISERTGGFGVTVGGVQLLNAAVRMLGLPLFTTNILLTTVFGDSDGRYSINAAGRLEWGDGASTRDTNLFRVDADELRTDDSFTIGASVTAAAQVRVKATKSGDDQLIPDAFLTPVSFNAEVFDVGAMHDLVTNNQRITIPTGEGGLYYIIGTIRWTANANGRRQTAILKNGVEIARCDVAVNDISDQTVVQVATIDEGVAADFYEIQVFQNRGGTLVLLSASSTFEAVRLW